MMPYAGLSQSSDSSFGRIMWDMNASKINRAYYFSFSNIYPTFVPKIDLNIQTMRKRRMTIGLIVGAVCGLLAASVLSSCAIDRKCPAYSQAYIK